MPIPPSPSALSTETLSREQGARVLVFGTAGYVGAHLVPGLQRHGCALRASGRNRKVLEARDWPGVELVEADAWLPDSPPGALAGVDTAYSLVRSMAAGPSFWRLDLEAADNIAAASLGPCDGDRDPRRHHRRSRFRGLRGGPRPRQPLATDADAPVGAVEVVADRTR
jgi:hypothetical protein